MKFFCRHGMFPLLENQVLFLLVFVMMLLVYLYLETGKKQYRDGVEYGSARFGTLKEKKFFYGKEFSHDTILAQNVHLTLLDKKPPQYDRNKNIAVIGGSGSGKTFHFVKPNLIQMNSSNIVVDPKDHLAEKTGKLFLEHGYQVKVLDLVNMKNSEGFNHFRLKSNNSVWKITLFTAIEPLLACLRKFIVLSLIRRKFIVS